MTATKDVKEKTIKDFQHSGADTGSPAVQIALLTRRIDHLTQHMRGHVKDYSSRRGLLRLVSRRRSLLDYVRREDPKAYVDIISRLNIRK